jgi:hypothetical protein
MLPTFKPAICDGGGFAGIGAGCTAITSKVDIRSICSHYVLVMDSKIDHKALLGTDPTLANRNNLLTLTKATSSNC